MTTLWIDGALVHEAEARISPFDHGLLTGDGVFETLRVARHRPFAARRHLERLARSAAGMGLPCPPPDVVRTAMEAVIEANGLDEGRLRVTLTGGPSPLGSDRGEAGPTLIVAGGALPAWPPAADVAIAPWPRNERGALAGIKSISYGENVVALAYARARGAGEAIVANLAGTLCEGTGSNVFVGTGGRLVTPPLASGCLAGVTRELVLALADVVEDDLPLGALASADEAFLTSSTRDLQPIRSVDGQPLASCPGPLTAAVSAAFRDLLARDLDP
ncbi:MAG: aminotransferase class IV [Acidimicrobiales bacterium]